VPTKPTPPASAKEVAATRSAAQDVNASSVADAATAASDKCVAAHVTAAVCEEKLASAGISLATCHSSLAAVDTHVPLAVAGASCAEGSDCVKGSCLGNVRDHAWNYPPFAHPFFGLPVWPKTLSELTCV
jgi:hypothetical protein